MLHTLKTHLSPATRFAARRLLEELRIDRIHRRSIKTAARQFRGPGLRINLGSGHQPKPGWVNVDLLAPGADLRLDLRRPLPFPDGAATYIYCEHFFEHLELPNVRESTAWDFQGPGRPSEALSFLAECRRVLAPGGVLDLVVPDAELMIAEYVRRHELPNFLDQWWGPKWCDTPMHCLNYLFRQGREHKYAYDLETLTGILERSGFDGVTRRAFDPNLDAPNHAIGSLCVTARKPG